MLGQPHVEVSMPLEELMAHLGNGGVNPGFVVSLMDSRDVESTGYLGSLVDQSLQDAMRSIKLCVEANREDAMTLHGGSAESPRPQPQYVHFLSHRMQAQLYLNTADSVVGIPQKYEALRKPVAHKEYD